MTLPADTFGVLPPDDTRLQFLACVLICLVTFFAFCGAVAGIQVVMP